MPSGVRKGAQRGPYAVPPLIPTSYRDARISLRLTQKQVAKLAGVSIRTVLRAEQGAELTWRSEASICRSLKLPVPSRRWW